MILSPWEPGVPDRLILGGKLLPRKIRIRTQHLNGPIEILSNVFAVKPDLTCVPNLQSY